MGETPVSISRPPASERRYAQARPQASPSTSYSPASSPESLHAMLINGLHPRISAYGMPVVPFLGIG